MSRKGIQCQVIKDNDIPYNKIYDLGVERCGCVPCTGHIKWREQIQKFSLELYRKVSHEKDGQLLVSEFEGDV